MPKVSCLKCLGRPARVFLNCWVCKGIFCEQCVQQEPAGPVCLVCLEWRRKAREYLVKTYCKKSKWNYLPEEPAYTDLEQGESGE